MLFSELDQVNTICRQTTSEHSSDALCWMLGGRIDELTFEEMFDFCVITGWSIKCMYINTVKARSAE